MNRLPGKQYSAMINRLVKLAYENELPEILDISYQIRSNTILGSLPEPALLRDAILLLESSKIQYTLIGGLAVNVYGFSRSTEDVDLLVNRLPDLDDKKLLKKFHFYGGQKSSIFMRLNHEVGFIDLLTTNSLIRKYAIKHTSKVQIIDHEVPVVSPAALIALKIEAIALDHSREAKDKADIHSIFLKSKPKLSAITKLFSAKELKIFRSLNLTES